MATQTRPPNRPKTKGVKLPVSFAARWPKDELEEIKRRAAAQNLNASEYVRLAALGKLPTFDLETEIEALKDRMQRLEDRAEASGW